MPDLADLNTLDRAMAAAVSEALDKLRAASEVPYQPGKIAVEMRAVIGQAGVWEAFLVDWKSGIEVGILGRFNMADIRRRAEQLVAEQN